MSKKKIITYIVLVLIGIGFIGDCVNRRQRNKLYRERVEELEQNFNDVKFAKGKADPVSYTHLDVYKRQVGECSYP